jgi:hypothetical protein
MLDTNYLFLVVMCEQRQIKKEIYSAVRKINPVRTIID